MCDKAFSEYFFLLKCCLGRYKTQDMCDKVVDSFLTTLKFVPDGFVTNKMIKKLYNVLFTDDNILFFDKGSGNVTFPSDDMSILIIDLNNINHD